LTIRCVSAMPPIREPVIDRRLKIGAERSGVGCGFPGTPTRIVVPLRFRRRV